jgi:CheY-like chemotaxis protein
MGRTWVSTRVTLDDEAEENADARCAAPDAAMIARWKTIAAAIASELDSEVVAAAPTPPRPRTTHPRRRILAVEDDPTTGELIRGFLGAAGYEVAICAEAADFEATLFAFLPDLMLMDLQLASNVSGYDLVHYVRESERFAKLPVIIVTSDSQRRAMLDSARAGADLLVAKPIDWDMLLTQIAECLTPRT